MGQHNFVFASETNLRCRILVTRVDADRCRHPKVFDTRKADERKSVERAREREKERERERERVVERKRSIEITYLSMPSWPNLLHPQANTFPLSSTHEACPPFAATFLTGTLF